MDARDGSRIDPCHRHPSPQSIRDSSLASEEKKELATERAAEGLPKAEAGKQQSWFAKAGMAVAMPKSMAWRKAIGSSVQNHFPPPKVRERDLCPPMGSHGDPPDISQGIPPGISPRGSPQGIPPGDPPRGSVSARLLRWGFMRA
jgi:hypothetical protein